jgi:hypothetical protein
MTCQVLIHVSLCEKEMVQELRESIDKQRELQRKKIATKIATHGDWRCRCDYGKIGDGTLCCVYRFGIVTRTIFHLAQF